MHRKLLRRVVVAALAAGVALALAAVALAAASFTDRAGDNNAAPDITSVTVSESADGIATIAVAVSNYQALPAGSWFNLWFDLDNNRNTGDDGDEALVQYYDDGGIQLHRWVGSELVRRPATGVTGTFAAGTLTMTLPKTALDNAASFGVLAIGVRSQEAEDDEQRLAGDFAPNVGNTRYTAPGPLTIPDATGDHEAAPDITEVDVSDTKAGTIRFAIATPSHPTLRPSTWIEISFDLDRRRSTGDGGVDAYVGIEGRRAYAGRWSPDEEDFVGVPGSGVRAQSAGGVVTFDVPRRFLEEVAAFDFYLVSGDSVDDDDSALDLAPNGDAWWKYTLANKPPLHLIAGTPRGIPARPAAGRRFTVTVPVLRSDTVRGITSGSVACKARVAGQDVSAPGRVGGGVARCTLDMPAGASGTTLRGAMTVRSGGKSVVARFTFPVRR
jgi:hypothetical protein